MKKKTIVGLSILFSVALFSLLAAFVGGKLRAQFPAAQGLDREIELVPPTHLVITGNAAGSTGLTAPRARGVNVRLNKRLMCVVQCQSLTVSGQLVVYFQSSADDGQTWQDFAAVPVNGGGTFFAAVSFGPDAAWPTTVPTNTDGTLANYHINQWGIGPRIRAKYTLSWGINQPGVAVFQAYVIPD
jgi:hypothetical protein